MEFLNLTTLPLKKDFFEKLSEFVFEMEKKKIDFGVVLVGRRRMRKLNRRFKGVNKIVPELEFKKEDIEKPTKRELKFFPKEISGEVILSPSYIKELALREKVTFEENLAFWFIHGILHLLGFDHKDTKSTSFMRKKEKEILKLAKEKGYV
jgi:probable rRNA maturation factor